ncbi:MAG: M67 family metallopeptidase [Magnetococcales bacterium]|nr:M67 family metallopeptidase [Magnetococcales bacterium]
MWVIPRPIVNKVLGHAQRTLPEECVGLLSGHGREITHWHPLVNVCRGGRRFAVDDAELLACQREIREAGREWVATYHSHPTTAAVPSPRDLAEADPFYRRTLQLIISLGVAGRLEMNGFLLQDGASLPQELTITG